jgi:carotenoid phi-ring synthase / carotenoid chi-ring synthase
MTESSTPAERRAHVVIAGAGIAGLSAAHVLAHAGLSVLVLERATSVGGKCTSYRDETLGHTVEHGIHGVFPRYENLLGLWAEAGIPDAVFVRTKSTGMVGPDGALHVTALAESRGPAPLFLRSLVPRGVLRIRDYLFAARFLFAAYAARTLPKRALDDTTFGGLLRLLGVSSRLSRVLLVPYVRNLTYARGDEVSARVALEALAYYVLERADAVRARFFDGGPSALVLAPWQRALEAKGVRFQLGTEVRTIVLENGHFRAFSTEAPVPDRALGDKPKTWIDELGHQRLGLSWDPTTKKLTALDTRCTHKGCPVALDGEGAARRYKCPCHGAEFALDGQVLRGPASEPLRPIALRHDAALGGWVLSEHTPYDAAGAGPFEGDQAGFALDIPGAQAVLPKPLRKAGDAADVSLLRTTSVFVLRLCFRARTDGPRWAGPDSGVFAEGDVLDNFFALHTFQREFAARSDLHLECHVSDAERFAGLDDASVYGSALAELTRYFPGEDLRARFAEPESRLLRHEGVFSLAAPGDLARTPHVSCASRPNLYFAGDWVLPDDPAHRGFFMERAAVTGIEAANAILRARGLAPRPISTPAVPRSARLMGLPGRVASTLRGFVRRLLGVD